MAQHTRTMSPVNRTLSPGLSPLRQRSFQRAATFGDALPSFPLRRSSTLSDSAQSLRSSTDSLLLPRAKHAHDIPQHEEPSHWHSIPLALALFPAVGGIVFQNGSAVVTDVTLLVLAAIFLNWSVRLPWDWYYAAQEVKIEVSDLFSSFTDPDTIIEEDNEEAAESQPSTPPSEKSPSSKPTTENETSAPQRPPFRSQRSAATELKTHELTALLLCFLGPIVGAWLLHHIRAQLSRPSEGLVSNYNLTIFLLASELRPLSHMIKLVQARTLYLQRIVTSNPHSPSSTTPHSPDSTSDLNARITALESNVQNGKADHRSSGPAAQQELVTATAKILQADLKPLDRAMRRYEKRATVFTMQTDARIQELESKLADALTLAAAAERTSMQSSRQRRGSGVLLVMDWVTWILLLPVQVGIAVAAVPGRVLAALRGWFEGLIGLGLGRVKGLRSGGGGTGGAGSSGRSKTKGPRTGVERNGVPGRGTKKSGG